MDQHGLRRHLGGIVLLILSKQGHITGGRGLQDMNQPFVGRIFQKLQNGRLFHLSQIVHAFSRESGRGQIHRQHMGRFLTRGTALSKFRSHVLQIIQGLFVKGFGRTDAFVIGHGGFVMGRMDGRQGGIAFGRIAVQTILVMGQGGDCRGKVIGRSEGGIGRGQGEIGQFGFDINGGGNGKGGIHVITGIVATTVRGGLFLLGFL
mmetsp:Transcript_23740/g.49301  ORF Transcript_23740/g.49301 Transcript_23740/m.49301 type:complete len:205 (-) Transcript_23740:263-877(-)